MAATWHDERTMVMAVVVILLMTVRAADDGGFVYGCGDEEMIG